MTDATVSRARPPLAETTNRINATVPNPEAPLKTPVENASYTHVAHGRVTEPTGRDSPAQSVTSPQDEDKRYSQASYASTSSSRSRKNYKSHIGPWQLGRTLGKGSSARVRLCRHNVTNQLAAVKIVNRRMANLVQDSSLAALSKWDSNLPEATPGAMRVPMAIEREVAILKLIEHPNIMKLYDIWENRSEIYLILEYVDQGDLFTFINCKGRLSEEVSLYFFRQIISAISYCHSFNICHRDLKPENILISSDLQIKIADFGMAALHQTDTHQLATACGSPHYAAPELLKNKHYRGDKADTWSLGVILYAMLSATLPFDDPDLRVMMSRTKKGQYDMPMGLSPEAEDLIRRMLQVNPERRISLKDVWRHPLVRKYAYLDGFSDTNGQLPETHKGFQYTPVSMEQIDPQLLRQLRSMWHMFTEEDLARKLSCQEPTDQKAFYWLLHNYREKQLEDFKPELAHSMSDYHHLQPGAWKQRVSTCQFAKPRADGQGQSVSRFTVISNAAETEAGTIQSYDPYRGSRILQRCDSQVSHAKIVVHRDGVSGNQGSRKRAASTTRRGPAATVRGPPGRPQSSRGSVNSLHSSRHGTPHARPPSLRHKRGVDFTHVRKRSSSTSRVHNGQRQVRLTSLVRDNGITPADPSRPQSPEERPLTGKRPKALGAPKPETDLFKEELRHFSSNIARDCDEAFKSSLMEDDSLAGSVAEIDKSRGASPFSTVMEASAEGTKDSKPWDMRPLPLLPSESMLHSPPAAASTPNSIRAERTNTGIEGEAQVSRLALPVVMPVNVERRVVSAPAYGPGTVKKQPTLPSIHEHGTSGERNRIVSAPPRTPGKEGKSSVEYLTRVENTIRIVHSPSSGSPVKIPKPLNVRKKPVPNRVLSKAPPVSMQPQPSAPGSASHSSREGGRKKSWFRRSSKSDNRSSQGTKSSASEPSRSESTSTTISSKKKGFNLPFWKSNKKRDSIMSIGGPEEEERQVSKPTEERTRRRPAWHSSGSTGSRNIEVKQSWLARLFRVKPATGYLCMLVSRKRARQEVAILLREWRKYGVKGIQVDKERNIVFARIGAKNYLQLKEVAFAAEVMTVIEHGKKQALSIVRFTQERGAASSFHRVVETMRLIFETRNLLVRDKSKAKMMVKTLNS